MAVFILNGAGQRPPYIVQSRPITTLSSSCGKDGASASTCLLPYSDRSHSSLGMSVFELASLFPLDSSGGRLYVDITHDLTTSAGQRMVMRKADNMDPLMASSVRKLLAHKDYLKQLPRGKANLTTGVNWFPWLIEALNMYWRNDPAILDERIKKHKDDLTKTEKKLAQLSGDAVFEFILKDKKNLQTVLYDVIGFGAILLCQFISGWLNNNIEKWLGEKNISNVLSKSVEHNVTSEMGLALGSVADVVRKYPAVIGYLEQADDDSLFDELEKLEGSIETSAALKSFLSKYGMRCPAEIDITKPRWYEKPTQLVPMIMSNVRLLAPGQHMERFEQGKREAQAKEKEILHRLTQLPGGARKAKQTKKMISIFHNFVGAREYPKYFLICRYAIYKKALMKEAEKLATAGIIKHKIDVSYLYLDEFRQVVNIKQADLSLIEQRKAKYAHYQKLLPPRIIMSDGEVPPGEYEVSHIPQDALVGVPVSPVIIEGRARIVKRLEDAQVEKGDILITTFTDPSWSPIFVSIAGLVTEVGGMMSHGAVITREYGLPAVVGVESATKLIKDGQKIRLNGTKGYVEIINTN